MNWKRHKNGIQRSEDGHVLTKKKPDEWELTTPDGQLHKFVKAEEAKQFVEGDGEPEPQPQPPTTTEEEGQVATKKKTAKKATAKKTTTAATNGDGDTNGKVTTRRAAGLDGRLLRMAKAAEEQGLQEYADFLRERVGKSPARAWGKQLADTIPDDAPDRVKQVAERFAGHLGDDPDEQQAARGNASGMKVYLSRLYADTLLMEKL